jgi:hypothetical protein
VDSHLCDGPLRLTARTEWHHAPSQRLQQLSPVCPGCVAPMGVDGVEPTRRTPARIPCAAPPSTHRACRVAARSQEPKGFQQCVYQFRPSPHSVDLALRRTVARFSRVRRFDQLRAMLSKRFRSLPCMLGPHPSFGARRLLRLRSLPASAAISYPPGAGGGVFVLSISTAALALALAPAWLSPTYCPFRRGFLERGRASDPLSADSFSGGRWRSPAAFARRRSITLPRVLSKLGGGVRDAQRPELRHPVPDRCARCGDAPAHQRTVRV